MNNSILVIVNTNSGYLKNEILNNDIIPKFCNLNYIISTCYDLTDLDKVLNQVSNFDKVIIIGGDGSISEIVQYIMKNELNIPIGFIPTGSGNGLVNSILYDKNIKYSLENAIDETLKFNIKPLNNSRVIDTLRLWSFSLKLILIQYTSTLILT